MWFWPVNVTTELVLHLFFLNFSTPNMSSRTPGWIPLYYTTLTEFLKYKFLF
jgi:hypothetical protein